jgi:hypothetical protein
MAKPLLVALILAIVPAAALPAAQEWLIQDFPVGNSADLKIDCLDASGAAFNFAGWTLSARIAKPDGSVLLVKTVSDVELAGGDPVGRVTVHLYANEVSLVGSLRGVIRATKSASGKLYQVDWIGTVRVVPHP